MFMEYQALELCSLFQAPDASSPIIWCDEGRGDDAHWVQEKKQWISVERYFFLPLLFRKLWDPED